MLGCSPRTVARRACDHGIGQRFGPLHFFSPTDVERLRGLVRSGPGNPLFGAGQPKNYGRKKKSKARK